MCAAFWRKFGKKFCSNFGDETALFGGNFGGKCSNSFFFFWLKNVDLNFVFVTTDLDLSLGLDLELEEKSLTSMTLKMLKFTFKMKLECFYRLDLELDLANLEDPALDWKMFKFKSTFKVRMFLPMYSHQMSTVMTFIVWAGLTFVWAWLVDFTLEGSDWTLTMYSWFWMRCGS